MDSSSHKFYPQHGFDSREHLETYFSGKEEMAFTEDAIKFPMETLHQIFNEGRIKGDLLIDLSNGSFIHHLYTASQFFKQILVLKCSEQCMMELHKYINTHTGAFEWDHIEQYAKGKEGNSDQCQGEDVTLKTAITKIIKCDFNKENITDPEVLPPADCVISAWLLDLINKDKDDYIRNIRKFIKLLKPDGTLILVGSLNNTYIKIGQDKIHVFKYDENFVRQVLADEGFIIDHCAVQNRTAVSDAIDYSALVVIVAHRKN
ncbi:nicotinamide N-methyltransferase-like [Pseudophryne corroboree]|uniref:nicotinamide N-methyltransferase-like n=1 Tax=Pseudophryne corroboree TaxID=495146 RepID=UPI003081FEFB